VILRAALLKGLINFYVGLYLFSPSIDFDETWYTERTFVRWIRFKTRGKMSWTKVTGIHEVHRLSILQYLHEIHWFQLYRKYNMDVYFAFAMVCVVQLSAIALSYCLCSEACLPILV